MSGGCDHRLLEFATVTVTFNPDLAALEAQLTALPERCFKLIVDNASEPGLRDGIGMLVRNTPQAAWIRNEENLGLAAAINRGVHALREMAPDVLFALLLDQDSEPMPGSCAALLAAVRQLRERGEKVGCAGPMLLDPDTGLQHGFHQCTRWRWRRIRLSPGRGEPVPCANLNGSGTLVPVSLFLELGGLDESLFIDHVDTEWAFRVAANGYSLWGVPEAVFVHRMGSAGMRLWLFGWHVWPLRSPRRHYFLYRNAVALMRRDYVPRVWKVWAVAKLALTAVVTAAMGPRRGAQLGQMWHGVREGMMAKGKGDA